MSLHGHMSSHGHMSPGGRSHVTTPGLMSQPGGLMSLQYVHHFLYCFYKKLIHSPSISLISLLLIRNPFGHMSNSFCPICCERFNASNRKHIRCPFLPCSKSACRSCYQSFLCSEHLTTPQCIFCHTLFTHSQLQHIDLPKSFLKHTFAKHLQDILFAVSVNMLKQQFNFCY